MSTKQKQMSPLPIRKSDRKRKSTEKFQHSFDKVSDSKLDKMVDQVRIFYSCICLYVHTVLVLGSIFRTKNDKGTPVEISDSAIK